uniref:Uncharacterized protein n=1 Tax=Dulem virus 96 TaxID=3145807 RepID=A0AAU8B492_9VIRU
MKVVRVANNIVVASTITAEQIQFSCPTNEVADALESAFKKVVEFVDKENAAVVGSLIEDYNVLNLVEAEFFKDEAVGE